MSLGLFVSEAFADTIPNAAAVPAVPPTSVEGAIMQFVPFFLIMGVIYFFMIRPQQKRFDQQKAMLEALRRGDRVVTGGGLIGTVVKVEGDEVVVELSENVKVRVVKNTITSVQAKTEPVDGAANTNKA